ncbi:hypothetical protein IAQ61_003346 [Plenodomus lingam]|uniref:uncharacterized protein n=1 Tax=Leptosphaeria maculans TaxID=5022 RepID=UPI003316D499|nr:hypothetical protein IAQ61_003346 [Plenodomus lingam]
MSWDDRPLNVAKLSLQESPPLIGPVLPSPHLRRTDKADSIVPLRPSSAMYCLKPKSTDPSLLLAPSLWPSGKIALDLNSWHKDRRDTTGGGYDWPIAHAVPPGLNIMLRSTHMETATEVEVLEE